jgi:DNA-binding NarL/FixJ family response regulator
MRLLIVDDEHSIRFSLKKYFELRSFVVDVASTAEEARRALAQHAHDVIILDIRLGPASDSTGLDLIEHIRAKSPSARIVVLSGYLSPETIERATTLRANLILSKPQPLAQLEQAIRELL